MLDLSARQRLVERSDLFQGLPAALVRHVATHAVERVLRDRGVLFLKHDAPAFLALVVSGRVYTLVHGPDGREQIVGSAGPDQVVGESALLGGNLRETSAHACGTVHLLVLGRRHFAMLCAEPQFLCRLTTLLRQRLLGLVELLESVCLHRLEARLARFLLANMSEAGRDRTTLPWVSLPENQGILACMLNTSRPKLNVQLQMWRRLGLISGQRDRILINDVDHLRRKACLIN